jgi:predicted GIY-YIG superfamily endonuclease
MTVDIDKRLIEHNQTLSNTITTKKLHDYELKFCTWVENRELARLVEQYLKSGIGRDFRNKILKI